MTSYTVTGSAANGTGTADNGILLTVRVLTGAVAAAGQDGQTAASVTANPPELAITPRATGSWVYVAVGNEGGATDNAFTPAAGTTFSQNVSDAVNFISYGTARSAGTTTAGTPVTLGATAPAKACFITLAEILFAGTPGEDASSPAGVNNQSGTLVSTASFSPPAGSLLAAQLVGHAAGGTIVPSVSDGMLAWFEIAADAVGATSIWIAQVPGPAAGAVYYPRHHRGRPR